MPNKLLLNFVSGILFFSLPILSHLSFNFNHNYISFLLCLHIFMDNYEKGKMYMKEKKQRQREREKKTKMYKKKKIKG